jgi:hypothetical protein
MKSLRGETSSHTALSLSSLYRGMDLEQQIYFIAQQLAHLIDEWCHLSLPQSLEDVSSNYMLYHMQRLIERLNQLCYAPNGRVPRAIFQLALISLLKNMARVLEHSRGTESAMFFLCMIDVWVILPFSRYIHVFHQPQEPSKKTENFPEKITETLISPVDYDGKMIDEHLDADTMKKRQEIDQLLHRIFSETIDYLYYEYPLLSEMEIQTWIARITQMLSEGYSLDGHALLEIREEGFFNMMGDAARFILGIDLSKFLKGFLEKFNETVLVYTNFLKRRERMLWYFENMDHSILYYLIYRELQKEGELHPHLALSDNIIDVQREEDYLVDVIKKLKRHLFPTGMLIRLVELITPHMMHEQLIRQCSGWETYLDAVAMQYIARRCREWLNQVSSSQKINKMIIEFTRQGFHDLYKRVLVTVERERREGGGTPSDNLDYQLACQMVREVTQYYLDEYKSTYGINWLNSPLRYLVDFDSLLLEAVSQLLELLQDQVFVKTWLFKNLDFIVRELTQNTLNIHYQMARSELERSLHHNEVSSSSSSSSYKDQEFFFLYGQDSLHHQGFVSLFEYLKGAFAITLAKNSVALIAFKTRSKWFKRSAWSASLGSRILQVSSNLYGIDEAMGQFIVSCIEETFGGTSQVGFMEDIVSATLLRFLSYITQQKSFAKDLRNLCHHLTLDHLLPCDDWFDQSPENALCQLTDAISSESLKLKMGRYIQWRLAIKQTTEHQTDIFNAIWTSIACKFRVYSLKTHYISKWRWSSP